MSIAKARTVGSSVRAVFCAHAAVHFNLHNDSIYTMTRIILQPQIPQIQTAEI